MQGYCFILTLKYVQMLVGVVAFNVLRVIPATDPRALGVLLIGYIFQGTFSVRSCEYRALKHYDRTRVLHDVLLYLHIHSSVRDIQCSTIIQP